MMHKCAVFAVVAMLVACVEGAAEHSSAIVNEDPGGGDDPPPTCGDTQWQAANTLASLYCYAHPEIAGCVSSVVGGWCTGPTDPYCDASLCEGSLDLYQGKCKPAATLGTMPAACWTLFQF